MTRTLTPKQAKFAKAKAQGKNNTDAAMVAYNTTSRKSAARIGSELAKKPHVAQAIDKYRGRLLDAMDSEGLTPESIAQNLKAILKITPEDKMRWDIHLSALEKVIKLQDLYPKQSKEMNHRMVFAKNLFNINGEPEQRTDTGSPEGPEV